MKRLQKLWCLTTLAATVTFFLAGFHGRSVSANNAPQTLPFSQNWTNTGLITANDDWSGVLGIEGYLGQDITTATGVDPRSLLTTSGSGTDLDVIANQTSPDTLTNGGVAEFEVANPSIALNGSGTADAPYILIYLNTTGQSNIRVAYNLRDLDGSVDNSIQPVALQYRVGSTGNFINVAGGFVADATTGPSQATLVTAVAATLPAAANNQAQVQVRIITSNAVGNDEWVAVDDISVTTVATAARSTAPVDFNGDGRTDFAVARNISGQLRWFYLLNGVGTSVGLDWGLVGDTLIPEDFDGDGKDDVAVWRAGTGTSSAFIILQSGTGTVRLENFGVIDDDASVAGDYDGDGKTDLAVFRKGANPGDQSTWFYKGSLNNPSGNITFVPWGINGDRVGPGDYDGDGKNDFVVKRDGPSQSVWYQRLATGATVIQYFGISGDRVVPGDYDGDGKTDLAVQRAEVGPAFWFYLPSSGGAYQQISWGNSSDFAAQGDYDGDGKTDVAVWIGMNPNPGQFLSRNSSNGGYLSVLWGQPNDFPIAFYNRH